MTLASENSTELAAPDGTIGISRLFTSPGVNPMTKWCGSVVTHASPTGKTAALPSSNSTSSSQKHGRLTQRTSLRKSTSEERLAHPNAETSLRQVIERVVRTITTWGREGGYFADDAEEDAFADELRYILVTQRAAFNSPVWFNIGVQGCASRRAHVSSCRLTTR